jgi:hypothetical protein
MPSLLNCLYSKLDAHNVKTLAFVFVMVQRMKGRGPQTTEKAIDPPKSTTQDAPKALIGPPRRLNNRKTPPHATFCHDILLPLEV